VSSNSTRASWAAAVTASRGASEKAPITIAVDRLPSGRLGRVRLDLADKAAGGLDQELIGGTGHDWDEPAHD
jgi:hypothetical protein